MAKGLAACVGAAFALLLPACGGSGGSGGAAGGSLLVQGRVVLLDGTPGTTLPVYLSGDGPYVTDADGRFTASGVPVPYTAVVVDGDGPIANVWPGLTRPDPVFTLASRAGFQVAQAAIAGKVTGGTPLPLPPSHFTKVFAQVDALGYPASDDAAVDTGAYDLDSLGWFGPFATTARLTAVQGAEDADGEVIDYSAYGELSLPIAQGDDLVDQDVALAPVDDTTIQGTATRPPGAQATTIYETFLRGLGLWPAQLEFRTEQGTEDFAFLSPVVTDRPRGLLVAAYSPLLEGSVLVVENLPAPALGLSLALAPFTSLVFPFDQATGVHHGTSFLVAPSPGGRVYRVEFQPQGGGGPTINLWTTSPEFEVPDLTDIGLEIPAGAPYTWQVSAHGPAASLDETLVPGWRISLFGLLLPGTGPTFMTLSTEWRFTFE